MVQSFRSPPKPTFRCLRGPCKHERGVIVGKSTYEKMLPLVWSPSPEYIPKDFDATNEPRMLRLYDNFDFERSRESIKLSEGLSSDKDEELSWCTQLAYVTPAPFDIDGHALDIISERCLKCPRLLAAECSFISHKQHRRHAKLLAEIAQAVKFTLQQPTLHVLSLSSMYAERLKKGHELHVADPPHSNSLRLVFVHVCNFPENGHGHLLGVALICRSSDRSINCKYLYTLDDLHEVTVARPDDKLTEDVFVQPVDKDIPYSSIGLAFLDYVTEKLHAVQDEHLSCLSFGVRLSRSAGSKKMEGRFFAAIADSASNTLKRLDAPAQWLSSLLRHMQDDLMPPERLTTAVRFTGFGGWPTYWQLCASLALENGVQHAHVVRLAQGMALERSFQCLKGDLLTIHGLHLLKDFVEYRIDQSREAKSIEHRVAVLSKTRMWLREFVKAHSASLPQHMAFLLLILRFKLRSHLRQTLGADIPDLGPTTVDRIFLEQRSQEWTNIGFDTWALEAASLAKQFT